MFTKPTYEELTRRVEQLEEEKCQWQKMMNTFCQGDMQPADTIEPTTVTLSHPSEVDLKAIINVEEIQSIMDDFCRVTGMVTAILDLKGNVLESTGWQEICTKFHRVHPDTASNCTLSDLFLAENLHPGEFVDYKCRNGLWDVVTPLYVGNKHMGNIYTGQFFYDDEHVDESFFVQQAETYGFDKKAYMEAYRHIPKYSRETVRCLMRFLVKFTSYISSIGLVNLRLEKEIVDRKRAKDALTKSEAHLHTLIRTIPDLVWMKDEQGCYISCNQRFESFFGAKEKDIIGKTDYDFLDTDLADFFRKHDLQAIAQRGPCKNEEEVTFASDGHREILETIKTPIYRDDGGLVGVLGIGRDITEHKRSEAASREQQAFIKLVMDNLPLGIAVNSVDPAVKFDYMNENFYRIYRTTKEALAEPDAFWTSVYEDPDFREIIKKRVLEDCASNDPERMHWPDVPISRKGEKTSFITSRNIPIPDRQLMISTVWDVTEQKMIEEELREKERLLNEVGRLAKIGGWQFDPATGKGTWTEEVARIHDIDPGEKTSLDRGLSFFEDTSRKKIERAITEAVEQGKSYALDLELISAKGAHKWVRTIGHPKTENGKIAQLWGSIQDVTEQKRIENEIRDLNRDLELRVALRTSELKEANKELEDFVYSVSHDLRAPLRSVSGFAEIIARRHKSSLNDEGRHYFDNIVKASKQMETLIDDLLQFSRLGKKAIKSDTVHLVDVLEIALETLSEQIDKTAAQIRFPDHMPDIQGDETLMTHILINLLENALKYRKPDEPPVIRVEVEETHPYIALSIADNGIGIEKDYHVKIFNIFQRLHTVEEYSGTGIGLAAVKKSVQLMGGEVLVESEIGKGSVFMIKVLAALTSNRRREV